MFQHFLIGQIGTRLNVCVHHLALSFHQRIQQSLKCRHIRWDGSFPVLISCHCHETVCRPGNINLQAKGTVVDVVNGFVKIKIRIHMEEPAQAGSGRGPFHISVFEDSKHGSCHIVEAPVLTDAMVNIKSTDAVIYPDTDAVIPAHCISFNDCVEIREGCGVIALCLSPGCRVIRHLGKPCRPAFSLLHLPHTEPAGRLQIRRDVYKIHRRTAVTGSSHNLSSPILVRNLAEYKIRT